MCGRFTLIADIDAIAEAFNVEPTIQLPARYNIAPTQDVVAILPGATNQSVETKNSKAHLELLRWGLIPVWAKDESIGSKMINARAETLAEKPSFRNLLRAKRCLIVADGFYEWRAGQGGKTPMYITMENGQPFAFAGLWDRWQAPDGRAVQSCTIITTEPNELMATIHNRMPAILRPGSYNEWLDPQQRDSQILARLLTPYPTELMNARVVSKLVNNPKNETAEILA